MAMKSGSNNFRSSAIIDVMEILKNRGVKIIIHEPSLTDQHYCGFQVINNLALFKQKSDVIVANRIDSEIEDVRNRIYTRDVFKRD